MLDCIKFLLRFTINWLKLPFTINVGFTNLGVIFCIIYILFPIMLVLVNSLKHQIISSVEDDFEKHFKRKDKKK